MDGVRSRKKKGELNTKEPTLSSPIINLVLTPVRPGVYIQLFQKGRTAYTHSSLYFSLYSISVYRFSLSLFLCVAKTAASLSPLPSVSFSPTVRAHPILVYLSLNVSSLGTSLYPTLIPIQPDLKSPLIQKLDFQVVRVRYPPLLCAPPYSQRYLRSSSLQAVYSARYVLVRVPPFLCSTANCLFPNVNPLPKRNVLFTKPLFYFFELSRFHTFPPFFLNI